MAPNNGLANSKSKNNTAGNGNGNSSRTTILEKGSVEDRGNGTNINSRQVISDQIQAFITGEGRASPKTEFRVFFTVWTFVTRLPGPTWCDHHPGYLMRGMAYFPLSGLLIGTFVSTFFDVSFITLSLPITVASVISEAASIWVTGCFHEDGLADSADGIGGGWSRDQILKIMTDSRLGTYGCAILLLYMIAKVELLATSGGSVWSFGECQGAGPAIIVTQTLARLTAPLLIKTRDYVDEQGPKYKFYSFFVEAKHLVTWHRAFFGIMTSFGVAFTLYGMQKSMILMLVVFSAVHFSGRYAEYLLGGVMGDYLGATICVTEIALLAILSLLTKIDGHEEFVLDLVSNFMEVAIGTISLQSLVDEILMDDRKLALVRFGSVLLFTAIWCANVGHPPVFVRTKVVEKGETNEIQIALDNNNEKNSMAKEPDIALEKVLYDKRQDFQTCYDAVRSYLDSLAKPVGSLGTLEDWGARLASLRGSSKPSAEKVACLIFAGDHGVAKDQSDGGESCSAYPQSVTQKVLEGLEYKMAGASVLAATNDVSLHVIDVGLATDYGNSFGPGNVVAVSEHKVIGGTQNFCNGPAMSKEQVDGCILAGRKETNRILQELKAEVIVFGEVGIGNTTTSSALIAAMTGETIDSLCGFGATTGRDGDANIISRKIEIVKKAMTCHKTSNMIDNPTLALQNVGGAEIAAIVGGILEASDQNIPVLVDGFIVTTAAMIAVLIEPQVCRIFCFATKSTEQGQLLAMKKIQNVAKRYKFPTLPEEPALNMDLRMGEGTGALLAVPLLRSIGAIVSEMATLNDVLSLKVNYDTNADKQEC